MTTIPTTKPIRRVLLAALVALVVLPAQAGGQLDPAEQPIPADAPRGYERLGPPVRAGDVGAGSLLLATEADGVYLPAPGLETEIHVRVAGTVARTEVRQRFHNPTDAWVEGVYVFPLPERSAVDGLHMVVGDRVIEGEIRERREAKRVYERARSEGRRASLVEQERPNLFTTSVANLGPDEVVEVVIHYQEELRWDGGIFSLRLPLVAAPRFCPPPAEPIGGAVRTLGAVLRTAGMRDAAATLRRSAATVPDAHRISAPVVAPEMMPPGSVLDPVRVTVDLDAGFPVERLGSVSHAVDVRRHGGGYRVRVVPEPGLPAVAADRDFVLEWAPAVGNEPGAAVFAEQVEGEVYALLMLMPPSESLPGRRLPRETVFVVDTSGSMAGESMEQARRALLFALDRLRPEDSFNVIRFSSDTEALFQESLPAGPQALRMARLYVEALDADGGTVMLPALRLALAGDRHRRTVAPAVRQVVFVTDGAVGNEEELFRVLRAELGDSRLFTVGIGSAPNGHFMRRAAELGRGTFTYVSRPDEAALRMEELFLKIDTPVLTDLEVTWSDPAAETWPQRVPDVYAGEPVVVAARLPSVWVEGGRISSGSVTVTGVRGGVPWRAERSLAAAEVRPGVAKLWARRKIAELGARALRPPDPGRAEEQAEEIRSAIVRVALEHHLVSQHTSLVAVDRTPARPAAERPRTLRLPVSLPAGWSADQVPAMPGTATPSRLLLLVGVVLLAGGSLLLRRRGGGSAWAVAAAGRSRPGPTAAGRGPGRETSGRSGGLGKRTAAEGGGAEERAVAGGAS